ncbi:MAG: GNAT family N-acetyltransferase [Verrucomicrobiota bacterium]
MTDLLVKLYELPGLEPARTIAEKQNYQIRRSITPETSLVVNWIDHHFGITWADEARAAFARQPVSCFVAQSKTDSKIAGFACYHSPFLGFFGPTGVEEASRGKGLGTALLLHALHALHDEGFAYAVIGQASSTAFYEKTVGAIAIPNSSPGPYAHMLRNKPQPPSP